jgi:hypothetical protein
MGVYDQSARWAAEQEPEALTRRLLRDTGLPLRFHQYLNARTTPEPGEAERTADQVAALQDVQGGDPWLLLHEFQSAHDPEKLDITLQEAARLRVEVRHGPDRAGKYKVLSALIYLRGRCPDRVLDMTGIDGTGTRHAPVIWEVERDEAKEALDALQTGRTTWGILFWIALMHGSDDPGIITRWMELAATLPPERMRAPLIRIALIFAELAGRFLLWEKGVQTMQLTESPLVNRWMAEAALAQLQKDVIDNLRSRFPGQVPADLEREVQLQKSSALLEEWHKTAATIPSIEAFLAYLRRGE